MYNNNSLMNNTNNTRGFVALWVMQAMGLGLMARPAEAEPFACVTNNASNKVSVIDTATNTVGDAGADQDPMGRWIATGALAE